MSELIARYESAYGLVELTPETVTRYLKRGNKDLNEQEIRLFIELCKYQKLNPFIGEAYAIKFGDEFQMIIGYDTYKRRAEENPAYRGRKSGIVVLRGSQVIQKEGTCLYPGEELIGGWCRVFRQMANGQQIEEYKEVSLAEYDKKMANWKSKPCTMIEKVAVSQALRAAFPKDYTSLYTAEEMGTPDQYTTPDPKPITVNPETGEIEEDPIITKDQRRLLFEKARLVYGDDSAEKLRAYIKEYGFESTTDLTNSVYTKILAAIEQDLKDSQIPADATIS